MNVLNSILRNMKKVNQAAMAVLFGLLLLTASQVSAANNHTVSERNENNSLKPSATFKNIWVDYDVEVGGELGMRVHVKFTAYGMKDVPSYLAIYFETAEGKRLKDNDNQMRSTSNEVAVYKELLPGYDPTDYNDLTVFMPYDQLDLGDGKWDLRMDVDVIYKGGGLIQHLTYKEFEYSQEDDTEEPETTTNGTKVNRIWVDYNVTRGGRKGMLIHVNFEVAGMKGVDSILALRVRKEDGDYLMSNNTGFSNDNGELEVTYSIKPGFETTVYEDAEVFLPYSEIVIRKGVWNLELDVDLRYEDGELIQHLDFYEFEFTRQ